MDLDIQDVINELYDMLMTLLHNYNLWWNGMRSIRYIHMLPILRRIQRSPEALQDIQDFEERRQAAKAVLGA